jgi:hypothetical protein
MAHGPSIPIRYDVGMRRTCDRKGQHQQANDSREASYIRRVTGSVHLGSPKQWTEMSGHTRSLSSYFSVFGNA